MGIDRVTQLPHSSFNLCCRSIPSVGHTLANGLRQQSSSVWFPRKYWEPMVASLLLYFEYKMPTMSLCVAANLVPSWRHSFGSPLRLLLV